MATYKDIHGTATQTFTADPPGAKAQGDIWYRSDIDKYKMGAKLGSWSSGGVLPAPMVAIGSGGTATAAWVSSGQANSPPSPSANPAATHFYNGTAWSDQSAAVTNNTWYMGSTGSQSAALMGAGGNQFSPYNYTYCEEWDGEAWSVITNIPNNRRYCSAFGSATTACIIAGSSAPGSTKTTYNDLWNGTSWSSETAIPGARTNASGGSGPETLGIVVGGDGGPTTSVEEYNGTSWSAGADYPTAVSGATSGGPNQACVVYGGNPNYNPTNSYDGTAWTAQSALSTGRQAGGRSINGTTVSQLAFGGTDPATPGSTNTTEEYVEAEAVKTITPV